MGGAMAKPVVVATAADDDDSDSDSVDDVDVDSIEAPPRSLFTHIARKHAHAHYTHTQALTTSERTDATESGAYLGTTTVDVNGAMSRHSGNSTNVSIFRMTLLLPPCSNR